MKKKAVILGACLLTMVFSMNVGAASVEIIGSETAASEMGESVEISSLSMKVDSIRAYDAEDEHYSELYINLLVQNVGQNDRTIREELSATLSYMSRYEFAMDLDTFAFPTEPNRMTEDYVLDPLCEMLVVLHAQIPKAVVEREGELLLDVSVNEEDAEFALNVANIEIIEGQRVVMDIPANALTWNGHKYCMFSGDTLQIATWEDAKSYCESLGGHLATITSIEENSAIYDFMNNIWGREHLYFGYSSIQNDGNWVWENGEESIHTNWADYEPNGSGSYAVLYMEGTWDDANFDYDYFICEWDYSEPSASTATDTGVEPESET